MKSVDIYTDGACSGNPGPGGYGAVLIYGETEKDIKGYKELTTNNEMELLAALKALEALKEKCNVKLHSDSAYLVNSFTQGWIFNWQKKGWTKKKGDLKNKELFKKLYAMNEFHDIEWIKVKGHSDNKYNNICDKIATNQIEVHRMDK